MQRVLAIAGLLLAGGFASVHADDAPNGELRLHRDERTASTQGPIASANALQPGLVADSPSAWVAEAELRHTLRAAGLSFGFNLLGLHERPDGGAARTHGRVNELYAAAERGAWAFGAGKRVLGWDVGYGFRPNDLVQQETRRTQLGATPEGRPLLQVEHFTEAAATTLVWVNPERLNAAPDDSRGARESALAGRYYRRDGALDWHGFARLGERTGGSVGAALAAVVGDELELHGSLRLLQRHDGWRYGAATASAVLSANPWSQVTLGGANQWLVGLNWTGAEQQSVMVEAWHDGSALPDADWRQWTARNTALAASSPIPPAARAGNLAWQATPFDAPSLRRDNLFVRLAWQPDHWQFTFDTLLTPADRGHVLTAGVQWQGDRWRLNASWRVYGGPAASLYAQLPIRRSGLLLATWAF